MSILIRLLMLFIQSDEITHPYRLKKAIKITLAFPLKRRLSQSWKFGRMKLIIEKDIFIVIKIQEMLLSEK